jgi:subtilase family serine protease
MTAQNWLRKRNSKRACIRRRSDLRVEQLEERYIPSVTVQPTYIRYHPAGIRPDFFAGPQGYTPAQIRQAYGIDQINFGGIVGDGTGQTIAIIDTYDDPKFVDTTDPNFLNSDLHKFDQQFGLPDPPSFKKVAQDGSNNYPPTDPAGPGPLADDWEVEESLDVEWAHAIAPAANILLV